MESLAKEMSSTIIFSSAKCEKEPCHKKVLRKNNSTNSLVLAQRFSNGSNGCILDGPTISPGASPTFDSPEKCCEYSSSSFDFYVINASTYDNSEFSNCDSLAVDYDILAHWKLTPAKLEARNFELSYP